MYALYAYHYRCELLALVLTYNCSQIQHILLITRISRIPTQRQDRLVPQISGIRTMRQDRLVPRISRIPTQRQDRLVPQIISRKSTLNN